MATFRSAPRRALRFAFVLVLVGCSGELALTAGPASDEPPAAASCIVGIGDCCVPQCQAGYVCKQGTCSSSFGPDKPVSTPTDDPSDPGTPPSFDASVDADAAVAPNCAVLATCGDASCIDVARDPQNCGACGVVCAGTCALGRCLVTLATGQNRPFAMAVDGDNVYWTNSAEDGDAGSGSVMSVPKAGGATTVLASGETKPHEIAVGGGNVYWTTYPSAKSVSVTGGTPSVIATGTALFPITTDAQNVYWADQQNGGPGQILAQPLQGGPTTTLTAAAAGSPSAIVVSDTAAFWFAHTNDRIKSMPIAGGTPADFAVFTALGGASGLTGLAIDSAQLYATFDNSGGAVVACPLPSGTCKILSNGNNGATAIKSDGINVYFLSPNGSAGALKGVVRKVAVGGGATEIIAYAGHDLQDIAVDDTSIYWLNNTLGTVLKMTPK